MSSSTSLRCQKRIGHMEMDWPSTFRADLSIQTYQHLANLQPFPLTGAPTSLSFSHMEIPGIWPMSSILLPTSVLLQPILTLARMRTHMDVFRRRIDHPVPARSGLGECHALHADWRSLERRRSIPYGRSAAGSSGCERSASSGHSNREQGSRLRSAWHQDHIGICSPPD